MKIGEFSKKSGCTIQTIRYYEKEGLIKSPGRSIGNYRLYNKADLKEIEFVKHCRSLDIPLKDIKTLLDLKNKPDESCSSVNELISNQLKLVNKRMSDLKSLRKELQQMKESCITDNTVDECGIMKSLDS